MKMYRGGYFFPDTAYMHIVRLAAT